MNQTRRRVGKTAAEIAANAPADGREFSISVSPDDPPRHPGRNQLTIMTKPAFGSERLVMVVPRGAMSRMGAALKMLPKGVGYIG